MEFLKFLNEFHTPDRAKQKADELLTLAESLSNHPYRGKIEDQLIFLGKEHRFLIYSFTSRKTIKVIYFIDESKKKVYVTDFFPTEMSQEEMGKRSGSGN